MTQSRSRKEEGEGACITSSGKVAKEVAPHHDGTKSNGRRAATATVGTGFLQVK